MYGQPIDYFYDSWQLQQSAPLPPLPLPKGKSTVTVDYDALTKRDKLQLAADLIHHVLQET